MNLFRTLLQTDGLGMFLTDAIHDGGKVESLTVYQIAGGVVQEAMPYTAQDLPDVVNQIEDLLTGI